MDKPRILSEIRRIAASNRGKAPGRERFEKETGISISEWYPHLWLRWGDALTEAGFEANRLAVKIDTVIVLDKYVSLIRELGRVPLHAELRVKARKDRTFPSHSVFAQFGGKELLLTAVRERCESVGAIDILPLLPVASTSNHSDKEASSKPPKFSTGYVYLMKSGRHFKIGRSNSVGRREWELGIKIPVPPTTIHYIETDDPSGVETYWHRRFADKRGEGEWFNLLTEDVAAFKRWKKIA